MEVCRLGIFAVLIVSLAVCRSVKVGASSETTNTQFLKTCCNATRYPDLCVKSLSSYSSKIKTSYTKLVSTALSRSLSTTKGAYTVVARLSKQKNLKPNEAAAMRDCLEELRDSIDEIKQSLKVMKNIKTENYDFAMSNVQTWMSAALTDEDTCQDGLVEESVNARVQNTVKGKISEVAQMTSNALALVNRAAIIGSPQRRSP